ncbi:hypothetical protein GQ43DRAFT_70969 [Delitschia confertaspora ATCC 74209]|uniref:Uncharacterized protein n=1 Tax=Delitschia confertaspora ATCC 74209 TaxID=1513339 RepID=A0A9P4JJH2_9PLEO|nr:hypothetical protein GQ43DRAFT_70969 [Delitschia confertaspora ATCC 74209]
MKLSRRLKILVIVQVVGLLYCGSLYFGWKLDPSDMQTRIRNAWAGSSHRLVVFGDDWSDTGEYRVSPPPKEYSKARDPGQGELWTEVLCKELGCDSIHNFARSLPSNLEIAIIGSLVDSDIYDNATAEGRIETLALFDFKTQVQQFLAFDKQSSRMSGRRTRQEASTFTVFFGIWDIWEYAVFSKDTAIHAINLSIDELFRNLDLLAERMGGPITVVIPRVPDVTFLPRFQSRKYQNAASFGHDQHQYVYLSTYWNTILSETALLWRNGDVFIPGLNNIIVDQIRAKQLHSSRVSDANGLGKLTPLFDDVEKPCKPLEAQSKDGEETHAGSAERCLEPDRHLFWDDMRISGPAHKLIGDEAARLLRGNISVNGYARDHANDLDLAATLFQNGGSKNLTQFELRAPPGY